MAKSDLEAMENRQRRVRVPLRSLQEFLREIKDSLGLGRECVSVCFIDDRTMTKLNRTYRKKPKTTDVLSFPSEDRRKPLPLTPRVPKRAGASYLGDIAISPVVARRNAKQFHRTLEEELRVLTLHGVLHLLGYDHETDRGEMERLERKLRRRFGLV